MLDARFTHCVSNFQEQLCVHSGWCRWNVVSTLWRKRKWKNPRFLHSPHIEGLTIPLPTGETHTRLLEIKSGDRDSPMECTLSVHKLVEVLRYSAVPY